MERSDREHARFMKRLRRRNWSLGALLTCFFVYAGLLPLTSSLEEILILLGIFLIFCGQFFYVTGLD